MFSRNMVTKYTKFRSPHPECYFYFDRIGMGSPLRLAFMRPTSYLNMSEKHHRSSYHLDGQVRAWTEKIIPFIEMFFPPLQGPVGIHSTASLEVSQSRTITDLTKAFKFLFWWNWQICSNVDPLKLSGVFRYDIQGL